MLSKSYYNSPIGNLEIVAEDNMLIEISMIDDCIYIESDKNEINIIRETKLWLDEYFTGKVPAFTPKLKLSGSQFKRTVSEIMLEIPYGELTTYGEIAKKVCQRLGKARMSAQAVGGAVGHNEISIIVPCHRVVGKDGNLTGYAGGLDRKIFLLKNEGVDFVKRGLYR